MPINTIIIEDIPANRMVLKQLLAMECPDVNIIGEAESITHAYELIATLSPDLIFLDIELKDGTGFELLQKLNATDLIDFGIIFFTANGNYEYAVKAIEYSALDFINKPIDALKLKKAIEKANSQINKQEVNHQVALLFEALHSNTAKSKRIAIHLVKGILKLAHNTQRGDS